MTNIIGGRAGSHGATEAANGGSAFGIHAATVSNTTLTLHANAITNVISYGIQSFPPYPVDEFIVVPAGRSICVCNESSKSA